MTIKEIAELCGVDQSTVWRWAQKDDLLQNAKGITVKLEEARKSGKDPAAFTLEETLAIIGEGGNNKALASLLKENAENKDKLVSGRYAAEHYGGYIRPAGQAADKTYELMVKYQHTDKISKPDALKLLECAAALRRYFYDTSTVTNVLVIHKTALEQRLLRTCHQLGISPDDVPTYKSWDKDEWPDFPELSTPLPLPLLD
jgi:predicted transcriptional regulator